MNKTRRKEMINDLLDTVWDWDIDALIAYVQMKMREHYENLDDETLTEEWNDWFDVE